MTGAACGRAWLDRLPSAICESANTACWRTSASDILQRGGQSLERRLIANLTERKRGLLPHAGLLVLERGHQRRHGLRVAKLAERERGLLANVVGLVGQRGRDRGHGARIANL